MPKETHDFDEKFYGTGKVYVLIDGANIFATAKNLGFGIDFSLLKKVLSNLNIIRMYYYTALAEDDNDRIILRPLVDYLDYNGYTTITKPAKTITNRDGVSRIKGNMDVEIAVQAMELAHHAEHIILFSGDGDFRYLVESLQRRGIKVTVASSMITQPPMVADELRKQADKFLDLELLKDRIALPFQAAKET